MFAKVTQYILHSFCVNFFNYFATMLPPTNGMTSFWRSAPGSLDNYRSTDDLPNQVDVLIVGAGYSGASLITHLLAQHESRDKSFVILEARQLCSGASGRNGTYSLFYVLKITNTAVPQEDTSNLIYTMLHRVQHRNLGFGMELKSPNLNRRT